MKHNLFEDFHTHLQRSYASPLTAKKYLDVAKRLFRDAQFDSFADLPAEVYIDALKTVKTPKQRSEVKQVYAQIKAFCPSSTAPVGEMFNQTAPAAFRRPRLKDDVETIDAAGIRRKINALGDHRLKLAYRTALASGLRVTELAKLNKDDITIENGVIKVSVKHGKGGKSDIVTCLPDEYLTRELPPLLDASEDGQALFHSAQTMKNEAWKHDFECHDLRRIAAQTLLATAKAEGMNITAARKNVQMFLRHDRFSTTKRYLYGKKRKFSGIKPLKDCETLCVTSGDTIDE